MKLHSPAFEKALRRSVKKAVRESPALKREARRVAVRRRSRLVQWIGRPVLACLLAALAEIVTLQSHHVVTGLAFINLWLLGMIAFQSLGLQRRLFQSADSRALAFLPISNDRIFQWQTQKCIRHSLFVLLDLVLACFMLAWLGNLSGAQWPVAFLVAVLCWATLMALAALHLARFPRQPLLFVSLGLLFTGIVVFFGRSLLWPAVLKVLDQSAPDLNLFLPTGWPVSLFQLLLPQPQWWMLIFLLPIAAIIATLPDSFRRLRGKLVFHEPLVLPAPDIIPAGVAKAGDFDEHGDEHESEKSPATVLPAGPTAIEEIIRSRVIFNPPTWPQRGWLEKWLWRWFSPRERALSEFVFPAGLNLTASWKRLFRNLAIVVAVAFITGLISPAGEIWILGIGLFMTIVRGMGLIYGNGRAFQPVFCSGVNISLYAGYGLGFRELSRLLLKYSLIQLPMFALSCLSSGAAMAWLAELPLPDCLVLSLKVACLLYAGRFVLLVFAFSAGTNDSTRITFRGLALIFFCLLFGFGFLALGICGLLVPTLPASLVLCAAAVVDAYVFFLGYQWFYHHGRIDLMSTPRPN